MPPRHVYGKRSRAIYDPLAAFASPQRSPADDRLDSAAAKPKDAQKVLRNGNTKRAEKSTRKPLEEINSNEVVDTVIPIKKNPTAKRAPRRKTVVEESEEGFLERSEHVKEIDVVKEALGAGVKTPVKVDTEELLDPVFEADNVPLFYDGYGYESEKEAEMDSQVTETPPQENKELPREILQESTLSDTPSISILPPTPPATDEYSDHCASLLDLSSHRMTDFAEWANQLSSHFNITKIAEASFGEVYRLSMLEEVSGFSRTDESVFKVIALKPPDSSLPTDKRKLNAIMKKMENMSSPTDVANEVRLLEHMTGVPGFTNFRDVRVVKGRPAGAFVKAFKDFNTAQKAKGKELSVFPDPSKKPSYDEDQLWAVIEMQDAGTDLEILVENGECTSIWSVWDIFWQVVLSLAKGEEAAEFEHRDLHLGNICVRQPIHSERPDSCIDTKRKLNFTNLETTIIDYTISRAVMSDEFVAYKDLSLDSSIFEGDSAEEYQYDIYRYMRSAIYLSNPYANFPSRWSTSADTRSWEQYHPVTNLIWLHFVLYKLREQISWPSATKQPPRKNEAKHAEWKKANDLEFILRNMEDVLDPGKLFENEILSASRLVRLAMEEGWINEGDIDGEWGDERIGEALAAQFEDLGLEVGGRKGQEAKAAGDVNPKRAKRKKG